MTLSCFLNIFLTILFLGSSAAQDTVHVVFSNHLDIGFDGISPEPGLDNNVINKYFREYFPRAVNLSQQMRQEPGGRFVYTTHAYLVSFYLDCPPGMGLQCPDKAALDQFRATVALGDIVWHAFPHNSQIEMFDVPLLEYALDLVHELDRQFELPLKTTMSQRDVPGLTRGAIPILTRKGVRALSVGVNGASSPPGVPYNTPFLWRDVASGEQLLAMWHPGGYGGKHDGLEADNREDCILQPGFRHALCVAWRGDNAGPPADVSEVHSVMEHLRGQFPGAVVQASTFDHYTAALLEALPFLDLPTVTGEIGDTWIHGVQSDPLKTADFRAVLRLRRDCIATPGCVGEAAPFSNFSRLLVKVPEHTWGIDIKTYPADYTNWTNAQLQACLQAKLPNYEMALLSWRRQALYIDWAVQALGGSHPIAQGLAQDRQQRTQLPWWHPARSPAGRVRRAGRAARRKYAYSTDNWLVEIDPVTGGLSRLQSRQPSGALGTDWAAGGSSALAALVYSTYDDASFYTIWSEYQFPGGERPDWFYKDFGKPGCGAANPRRADSWASLEEVVQLELSGQELALGVRLSFPPWTVELAGAPAEAWRLLHAPINSSMLQAWTVLRSPINSSTLHLEVWWVNKSATKLPEALWLRFKPGNSAANASTWRMNKLGSWISPLEVIRNGSHSLHAVQDEGVTVQSSSSGEVLQIRSLDASLVSPGVPTPFPNLKLAPDLTEGCAFNLVNNIWGTNYVMWVPYSDRDVTMAFRFQIEALMPEPTERTVQVAQQ